MNIKNVLSTNAHWQVNKHLSRVFGDLRAAVLLSELIDCYLFFANENKLTEYNGDMYFYETSEKMEDKTTLSYREQKTVISILENTGVIKTKRMGTPAKLYFSVCEDKIWELLKSNFDKNANQELTKTQIKNLSFVKTRIDKNANQDVAKTQNIYNKENNIKKINKENNIFLEKKINSDHSLDVGKMVNNENYRFADANNTIDNEGYRQEAEEKNYPPYSAAPPIKKEEKNENDFKAVLGGEKVEEVEYIANEEIGGKKRKKQGKKQIEKYINEFGQCVSLNDNGEEVRWFGVDGSNNVGLTMAEMENLKNKYGYDKSSFLSGIEMFSNWKLQNPEKADKKKSDYLPMAGGGWVYKELLKMKKINNNQEKIDKIDKYEKLINETLKKYEK